MNTQSIPTLIVENLGVKKLGNCYYSTNYKIKSLNRMLSTEDIKKLREIGVLGYGQEFDFVHVKETEPADDYNRYYVVLATSRCDSSD